jgi:hypothetical protein
MGYGTISYNSTSGVITYVGPTDANIRQSISFVSGAAGYNNSTGVISIPSTTTNLSEGTNLYFTSARVRSNVSAVDAGGLGSFTYSSASGAFTYTGPSDSDVRTLISAGNTTTGHGNISYNNSTGAITFSRVTPANILNEINAGNVKLKLFSETVLSGMFDSGAISLLPIQNGTIRSSTLIGNITQINFSTGITAGITVKLILRQDAVGNRLLDTTSNPGAWANWEFVNNNKTLSTGPNEYDMLTVTYDGSKYLAKLDNFSNAFFNTDNIAEGTTNLYFTTARANSAISAYKGNINTVGSINADSGFTTSGNVQGSYILGNGALLSGTTSPTYDSTAFNIGFVNNTGFGPTFYQPTAEFTYNPGTKTLALGSGSTLTLGSGNALIGNLDITGTITGVTTSQVTEGTNLYFTADRANSNVVSHIATVPLTVGGNLTVTGNINATGNINVQNVEDLYVRDQTIVMNANAASPANVQIVANRPGSANTEIKWNEQDDRWTFTNDGTTYYNLPTSTTDVAEGANLYYSNARVNSFIQDNITTTDIDEGTNLYFTAARARGNISAAENITYNSTTGVIGLANALGNVNSVTSEASTNLTLNSDNRLVVTERLKGVATNVGNISGDGYGFFSNPPLAGGVFFVQNVNAGNLDSYYFTTGNTTAGSNVVTGVSLALIRAGAPNVSANINLVTPYYAIGPFGAEVQDPFPAGTYVTSVDAANSTITLNNPAAVARDLSVGGSAGGAAYSRGSLIPGAFDPNTGFLVGLVSEFTAGFGGLSRSALAGQFFPRQGNYGYPVTGPAPSDFVYAIGNSSNYSQGNVPATNFAARTNFEGTRTVFAAPRGLVVGNGDLTSRAENDAGSTFGINVLWDGLTTGATPNTQLLLKQYSDNSFASTSPVSGGPRVFFTAARGNKNQSYLATYPRNNDEMGRLTWWGPTQFLPGTSTLNAPAWISGVAGQDFVDTNSGMGMYFANSPNTTRFDRSLYLASTKGATLIASAADSTNTHQPVIFAPSHLLPTGANAGNSVFLYNQTVSGTETAIDSFAPSGAHFAQINYANATGLTGSRFTVTNGNNFATEHEGNIALSLDRNSNTANVRIAARNGFINYLGSSNPDRVRFDFAAEGLANATPVTISGFTNATVAGALNGNVFFVRGPFINGSFREYELYTDSGLTTGVNLGVTNVNAGPGIFTYTRTNSVTAKDWSWVLPQGSNSLILAEDGVTTTTFASGGNINLATNATINYDAVYGCFHNMANVTAAAADTVYEFQWPNVHINTNRVTVAGNSQITIGQEGAYVFSLEMQAENTDNQDRTAFIWLAKNGTDIEESCLRVSLLKEWKQVIIKEWIVNGINANDYIEVRFAVDNPSGIQLTSIPAQASPYARPAVPSAVITVTPVGA